MRLFAKARPAAQAQARDVAASVVTDCRTGQIVYHEVFESAHLAPERVADKLLGTARRLERRFPAPRYDVEHGVFGTRQALLTVYPGLGGEEG